MVHLGFPLQLYRRGHMKMVFGNVKSFALATVEKAKLRKGLMAGIALFFVLQVYFVRELLAAELLFGA